MCGVSCMVGVLNMYCVRSFSLSYMGSGIHQIGYMENTPVHEINKIFSLKLGLRVGIQ